MSLQLPNRLDPTGHRDTLLPAGILFWLLMMLWLSSILLPADARAQASVLEHQLEMEVQVGFGDRVARGAWTPVFVTLTQAGGEFRGELEIEVTRGQVLEPVSTTYSQSITLSRGGRQRLVIPVFLDEVFFPLQVRLTRAGRTVMSREISLRDIATEGELILVLSRSAAGMSWLQTDNDKPRHVVYATDPSRLPDTWIGYDGFTTVILRDMPAGRLTPAQTDSLAAWVEVGGHLVITGGSDPSNASSSLVQQLAPVRLLSGSVSVPLSNLAIADVSGPDGPIPVWAAQTGAGRVTASSGEIPLVAHYQLGKGHVTYLAFDPLQPSIAAWPGLPLLLEEVLHTGERTGPDPFPSTLVPRLWDALRTTEMRYPDQGRLFGFMALFIGLVVGVHRLALTRPLIWAALPVVVIASVIYAHYSLSPGLQSFPHGVVQTSLLVAEPRTGQARTLSLMGMVRPVSQDWKINVEDAHPAWVLPVTSRGSGRLPPPLRVQDHLPTGGYVIDALQPGTLAPVALYGRTPFAFRAGFAADSGDYLLHNASEHYLSSVTVIHADGFVIAGDLPPGERVQVAPDPETSDFPSTTALSRALANRLQPVWAEQRDTLGGVPAFPHNLAAALATVVIENILDPDPRETGLVKDIPFVIGFVSAGPPWSVRQEKERFHTVETHLFVAPLQAEGGDV